MTGQVVAIRVRSPSKAELARLALMAVQYKAEVGAEIRRRREALEITQAVLASRVEDWLREHGQREPGKPFNAQNVSRWERGANMAEAKNLEAVAAALETTVPELMAGIRPKKKAPDLMGQFNGDMPEWARELEIRLNALLAHFEISTAEIELARQAASRAGARSNPEAA